MSLIDVFRKGIGYVLMAMGASSSQALKKKAEAPPVKPDPHK
jgi:hypothetical protein